MGCGCGFGVVLVWVYEQDYLVWVRMGGIAKRLYPSECVVFLASPFLRTKNDDTNQFIESF